MSTPESKAVARRPESVPETSAPAFSGTSGFALAQRMATALASSDLVPDVYKGKEANCLIALEMANRAGVSPMTVMQNLHIIKGRPSWSSSYLVASANACGRFSPLRYELEDLGKKQVKYFTGFKETRSEKTLEIVDRQCRAFALDLATGDRLDGPWVSIEMAVKEGWYTKNDSKWITLPDLMIRYRAAAFWVRIYAPEIAMGMPTADEVDDISIQELPKDLKAIVVDGPKEAPRERRPRGLQAVVDQAPKVSESVGGTPMEVELGDAAEPGEV